ncbi:MAG: ATP-dependent Clp protease adaptor ClpS [Flavobacteriaceae bacterium]|jgi:ATP-dependent Clp protease adaptor protein ClpS|nr:ATP-dependent Clp protease adaptor ClpS [Flavobacteriaceae bacterium]MDC1460272.1 ATP-dependent Clp protease adaptor ClpS [Flavobacteriaceae bacterium]MDG1386417.1 ATP-dependent Clp protease adaptor ClpS [Flavobacteriaceae bacterium]
MATNPEHKEQEQVDVLSSKEYEIILHNDDVNTFDHVINCLIRYCDHTLEQAEQCAYIVHYRGKCTVKTGSFEDLEPRCSSLLKADLSAELV